ncbi:MAG: FAD-dependent monooxygenase [Pirellulales bacterium]
MNANTHDLLIIGAGPVGLTMATAAHRQGLTCRIIDKAAAPSDKSKALVLWSRSLELFDKIDDGGDTLAQTFVAAGMKIDGARIYADGKPVVHVEIAGVDSPFGFPLMIPQNVTERLLTEHLAAQGITIEREVELISFEHHADAVRGTLRHADGRDEAFVVPWLIGCDGADSAVRHTLGMPFTGGAEQNDWMLADIHLAGPLPTTEISIFWHEQGILVFFPIGDRRFRMIADLGPAAGTGAPPSPTLAQAQAMVDARGPAGLTLSQPIWLAGFRINERKVTDYRQGRVMLAGDAAHIHSPAGGQGMNTGMQDAFNLAWKLGLIQRGQGRVEPLLESYSRERSAVGDQVLTAAARLTTVATLRNPLAQFVRNHVAGLVTSFGFVQDKIRNGLCELSINYRGGPLTHDDALRHGELRAGDRLPDAALQSPKQGTALDAVRRTARTATDRVTPSTRRRSNRHVATGRDRQIRTRRLRRNVGVSPAASPRRRRIGCDSAGRRIRSTGVVERRKPSRRTYHCARFDAYDRSPRRIFGLFRPTGGNTENRVVSRHVSRPSADVIVSRETIMDAANFAAFRYVFICTKSLAICQEIFWTFAKPCVAAFLRRMR